MKRYNDNLMKIKVGIVGSTGYTGVVLVRLLLNHPNVEITYLSSEQFEGKDYSLAYPMFYETLDLKCKSVNPKEIAKCCDLVFLATPNDFSKELKKENTFHFYSNRSAPTDNPRVERSRLTGDAEFYSRGGNVADNLQKQKEITQRREDFYNFKRRHQALAYLTPMEFYVLWKKNPAEAYTITAKWQEYLKKQRLRLATSGRIKKKEQIETLMKFIDAKLKHKKEEVEDAKNQLINCKLCSVA